MSYIKSWIEYPKQVLIALDQLVNAAIPPFTGSVGYADETLSARSYRSHRDGRWAGKLTMPIINLLFFWQGKDHCKQAWISEMKRKNMPAEYSDNM